MDSQQLKFKIKHFIPHILGKHKKSGLLPLSKDERDFNVGSIFGKWFGVTYAPKNQRICIKTLSVKDQESLNTCVFNAATVQKEIDEGVVLSVKSLVRFAKRKGYISGNGFSNVRNGQKVLQEFGAMEEKDLPDTGKDNWNTYSEGVIDMAKAEKHKSKSFWSTTVREDNLKLLDEGKAIACGMNWFSGFNQSGGFRSPWLIDKDLGYSVGGHSVVIVGYDLNYYGKKVYIIQNSYSAQWGGVDEHGIGGKFYVDFAYMEKNMFGFSGYGAFANLDLPVDAGKFIVDYDNKNVKAFGDKKIYFIEQGKKRPYKNEMDYFVYNVNDPLMKNFELVDGDRLKLVPLGEEMNLVNSPYWDVLKYLERPLNLSRIMEAIKTNK